LRGLSELYTKKVSSAGSTIHVIRLANEEAERAALTGENLGDIW
jgi:hypothetical protein